MKVWNQENEYDIEAPSGYIYRISIHDLPKGFEDHFNKYYSDNSRVFFNDCWMNIQRLPEQVESQKNENIG